MVKTSRSLFKDAWNHLSYIGAIFNLMLVRIAGKKKMPNVLQFLLLRNFVLTVHLLKVFNAQIFASLNSCWQRKKVQN